MLKKIIEILKKIFNNEFDINPQSIKNVADEKQTVNQNFKAGGDINSTININCNNNEENIGKKKL